MPVNNYPARYRIEKRQIELDPWSRDGNGSNDLAEITERCRRARERNQRLVKRTGGTPLIFRVWDRIDQKELVVS